MNNIPLYVCLRIFRIKSLIANMYLIAYYLGHGSLFNLLYVLVRFLRNICDTTASVLLPLKS